MIFVYLLFTCAIHILLNNFYYIILHFYIITTHFHVTFLYNNDNNIFIQNILQIIDFTHIKVKHYIYTYYTISRKINISLLHFIMCLSRISTLNTG